MKTITLAHYYTTKEVQDLADHVGDSLDLAQKAQESNADRIVFAGVRFMAETAKLLNPEAEVILPDWNSTCSLVEQTNTEDLKKWLGSGFPGYYHLMYINSSVEQKATADYIVTSRNVEAIARAIHKKKEKFLFSPDRNMGNWLSRTLGVEIPSWSAVCEVHDQFDRKRLEERFESCEYRPVLIAHPESPMNILERADYVGSTAGMLEWIDTFGQPSAFRGTSWTPQEIFVATEFELIRMMRERRPDLKIWQVPVIADCRCNECPYMKLNSAAKVKAAIAGEGGTVIDYLDPEVMEKARVPVERMMYFNKYGHLPDGPGS